MEKRRREKSRRFFACEKLALGPVSRILFCALRRFDRHFSHACGAGRGLLSSLSRAKQAAAYPWLLDGPPSHLFCLAPEGVFRAADVTVDAVGSYPTFSPLPHGCPRGGL